MSTALGEAARDGSLDDVRQLLSSGAHPDSPGPLSVSPLLHACIRGHDAVAVALLEAGADPNATDASDATPLHWAARRGSVTAVAALVVAGADRTAVDCLGLRPIDNSDNAAVNELLGGPTTGSPSPVKQQQQQQQSQRRDRPATGSPAAQRLQQQQQQSSPTSSPYQRGGGGGGGGGGGLHPVHAAAESGNVIDLRGVLRNDLSVISLQSGPAGDYPLHCAARSGDMECVLSLIDAGAEVDAVNDDGWTALHVAAAGNHFYATTVLVQRGNATCNVQTPSGEYPWDLTNENAIVTFFEPRRGDSTSASAGTAASGGKGKGSEESGRGGSGSDSELHAAAVSGDVTRVKALISAGADIEARGADGLTPCFVACEAGRLETALALAKAGADLTVTDSGGQTMLHIAVAAGHGHIAGMLIERGVNALATDVVGRIPADLVRDPHSDAGKEMKAILAAEPIGDDDIAGMLSTIAYASGRTHSQI